jgi:hypothetical protein
MKSGPRVGVVVDTKALYAGVQDRETSLIYAPKCKILKDNSGQFPNWQLAYLKMTLIWRIILYLKRILKIMFIFEEQSVPILENNA